MTEIEVNERNESVRRRNKQGMMKEGRPRKSCRTKEKQEGRRVKKSTRIDEE